MKRPTTLKLLYVMHALFAGFFAMAGIGNFAMITKTPEFDTKTLIATVFLVLDIILFFYYNSRALDNLKELRELKNKKSE